MSVFSRIALGVGVGLIALAVIGIANAPPPSPSVPPTPEQIAAAAKDQAQRDAAATKNQAERDAAATAELAAKAAKQACNQDWRACADNAALANSLNPVYRHASVACKMAADAQVKYGTPVWPWLKFGSFYPGDNYIKTGKAVLVEPDAQFQNAFGAMVHSRVVCTYDMSKDSGSEDVSGWGTQHVVSVFIVPK